MNSELDSNLIDSHFERMLAFRERSSLRTIDYEDELVHGVYYLASVGDVGSKWAVLQSMKRCRLRLMPSYCNDV